MSDLTKVSMKDLKNESEDDLLIMCANEEITNVEYLYNTHNTVLRNMYFDWCKSEMVDSSNENAAKKFLDEFEGDNTNYDISQNEETDEVKKKEEENEVQNKILELAKDRKFIERIDSDRAVKITFYRLTTINGGSRKNCGQEININRTTISDDWYIRDLLFKNQFETPHVHFIDLNEEKVRQMILDLKEKLLSNI